MVQHRFTGNPYRENIYEYPFEAIREAVINSVMHKDYFEHGHNNILKFFPDHIQIENIWMKPKRFILGKTVYRRNKILSLGMTTTIYRTLPNDNNRSIGCDAA